MHRFPDPLQDGDQGRDGFLDQEHEADLCRAPELVRCCSFDDLISVSGTFVLLGKMTFSVPGNVQFYST